VASSACQKILKETLPHGEREQRRRRAQNEETAAQRTGKLKRAQRNS